MCHNHCGHFCYQSFLHFLGVSVTDKMNYKLILGGLGLKPVTMFLLRHRIDSVFVNFQIKKKRTVET